MYHEFEMSKMNVIIMNEKSTPSTCTPTRILWSSPVRCIFNINSSKPSIINILPFIRVQLSDDETDSEIISFKCPEDKKKIDQL